MNVLFVSPEVSPFARTGGLGEVVGSLPSALKKQEQMREYFALSINAVKIYQLKF